MAGGAGSNDDRNRSAVRTPSRPRDVPGPVRAEKGDDGGDLFRLREAPERPSLAYGLQHLPDGPDEAHDVELPHLVPLAIRQLLEPSLVRNPDVVDQAPHWPERVRRLGHELARRGRVGEIADDAELRARLAPRPFHPP